MSMKIPRLSFQLDLLDVSELKSISSPEQNIQGVPWVVHVDKVDYESEQWIALSLQCAKEHLTSKRVASLSCMVIPSSAKMDPIEKIMGPCFFETNTAIYGKNMLSWKELLEYVEDDKVTLEIEIEVEDPIKMECDTTSALAEAKSDVLQCFACGSPNNLMRCAPTCSPMCNLCGEEYTTDLICLICNRKLIKIEVVDTNDTNVPE